MMKLSKTKDVAEMYKKLPSEKKTFVLGIMQGILIAQPEVNKKKEPEGGGKEG